MTYDEFLAFYKLSHTEETHIDWLYNEWYHGRAYQYKGEFYHIATGKKLGSIDAPQINREKLKAYLEHDMIIEFASSEDCLNYFNTYDGQHFQTVDEMKAYQGTYGFGIDEKWYHISFDKALDVWSKPSLSSIIQASKQKKTEYITPLFVKGFER